MSNAILEMSGITKQFTGVKALDNVNFQVKAGAIHALCGENGAGKSTLMKVLSGVYPFGAYAGDIIFEGQKAQFKNTRESEEKGIVIIHQELALIPYLSIAENIFLGNERTQNGVINWNKTLSESKKYLELVGLKESPETLVCDMGIGKQQLVEIAKAISKKVKLLILDEPTASLNEDDSKNLLDLLLAFKKQGMTSIIISHKLNEVTAISDAVTILRDGQTIETIYRDNDEISEDRIIKGMVGRDLTDRYPKRNPKIGGILLEVKNWTVYHEIDKDRRVLDDVSFSIKKGEIVGIAGLMGAGRTELAMSLFGKSYGSNMTGTVIKDGKELKLKTVAEAIKAGFAYVSEDRKGNGLILEDTVAGNISLPNLDKLSKHSVMDEFQEAIVAEEYREKMKIKTPHVFQKVGHLSGGNQQKVALSKWVLSNPDILFLDEPTRGIDVGAKYEIYTIIQALADQGKGICIISSELPEVLGMCDRIYAMAEGRIMGELTKAEATQEKIMAFMTR